MADRRVGRTLLSDAVDFAPDWGNRRAPYRTWGSLATNQTQGQKRRTRVSDPHTTLQV